MNRLWILSAATGAFFFVSIGVMAATSTRAIAQDAKPASNVNVVNATSSPVPVSIQGTPSVDVGSPTVSVNSLPAVQIDGTNPVPVQVQNFPAGEAVREPVTFNMSFGIPGNGVVGQAVAYDVPEGKRLVLEYVSISATTTSSWSHRFSISVVGNDGSDKTFYFSPERFIESTGGGTEFASQQVRIYASAGPVRVTAVRNVNPALSSVTFGAVIAASGYLEDVPAEAP